MTWRSKAEWWNAAFLAFSFIVGGGGILVAAAILSSYGLVEKTNPAISFPVGMLVMVAWVSAIVWLGERIFGRRAREMAPKKIPFACCICCRRIFWAWRNPDGSTEF